MTTAVFKAGTIEITDIDGNWDYQDEKPDTFDHKPRISSIEFHPGAASDSMTVRDKQGDGLVRFYCLCDSVTDSRIKYFHGSRVDPYILLSDLTLSAGHRLVIELWRE